ncbi:LacI family DNA-binding transcriptional regulator [Arthrobacter silvisoli]|uniref:LacI family DNA-binding transcriptional regulator n=1 Tax=Arthrobacter silvisoli TaxID=2291022 RepID=UPI000E2182A5|nr:LacI family DNA-binding transcriptional regulator [Arthrobacter silvisoli]
MGRVAITDVASAAGVSKTTVSNFYNAPHKLSEPVRARVSAAIQSLGYVRSDAARRLRAGSSTVIGHLTIEIGSAWFSEVANEVEKLAAEAGFHVLVANTAGNKERERQYLELFAAQQVRGVIVASQGDVEPQLQKLQGFGIPFVLTGQKSESPFQASVSVDDRAGGYLAVKHLIERGKRRICFVGGPLEIRQVSDRFHGASQAVSETPKATLEIVLVEERTLSEGRNVAQKLLSRGPERVPDGIFAANDLLAIGLLDGILRDGRLGVPEDVAVIGYDDLEVGSTNSVPVSTIHTSPRAYGRAAINLLLQQFDGPGNTEQRHVVFEPQLIIRSST